MYFLRLVTLGQLLLFFMAASGLSAAETTTSHEVYLERANAYIKAYRHFSAADALQQAARLAGDKHPSIHMRLAILYYGLGLIPEAIAAGEIAVTLAPNVKWYKFDLAKFFLVDKQFQPAKEQLMGLLEIDPGFTLAYVYLGEIYLNLGQKNLAWACLERAESLGHESGLLRQKVQRAGGKPAEQFLSQTRNNKEYYRFIKLAEKKEADSLLKQIESGRPFENLELELQNNKMVQADFGIITTGELDQTVAKQLAGMQAFAKPLIVQTGADFRIMQKILPFERAIWVSREAAGQSPSSSAAMRASLQPEKDAEKKQIDVATATSAKTAVAPVEIAVVAEAPSEIAVSEQQVREAVEQWRAAWQMADMDQYFASYSQDFVPSGKQSIADWRSQRIRSLATPSMMEIKLSRIEFEHLHNNQLRASFQQVYRSDRMRDKVRKSLIFKQENGKWKIISEMVEKNL